jgi:hypothetical protein
MSAAGMSGARALANARRSGSVLEADDIIIGMESSMATAPAMRARRVRRPRWLPSMSIVAVLADSAALVPGSEAV